MSIFIKGNTLKSSKCKKIVFFVIRLNVCLWNQSDVAVFVVQNLKFIQKKLFEVYRENVTGHKDLWRHNRKILVTDISRLSSWKVLKKF